MILALASLAAPSEVRRDAPGAVMPDRYWDVVHLDLDVKIDIEAGSVEGTTRHTLDPIGRFHGRIRLHQRALEIEEVRVDGAKVEGWRVHPDFVEIDLPDEAKQRTVEIDYRAKPALGLHFRTRAAGDRNLGVWSQGEDEDNRYWFPSWDTPNDRFTVNTAITVRDGLIARSNGKYLGAEPADEGWTRHAFTLEQPIVNYLVAVVAGELQAFELDGPAPLEILGPRSLSEAQLRMGAEQAADQMAYFETLLDEPFPYPVYRQAWVERFMYGGMENAGLSTLALRRVGRPHEPDRLTNTRSLVAHELAHQWFGDLVTCYGWRELWLNEGFATYYDARWQEHSEGPDAGASNWRSLRESGLRVQGPLSARAHSYDGHDNNGVYVKGSSFLRMLEKHLGREVFDAGIRHYLDVHGGRLVESEDLRRSLEDVSGQHLGWAFDQWVHGHGIPSWSTTWSHREGQVTVSISPKGDRVFHAPVEVEVGLASGPVRKRLWLGEGASTLVIDSDTPPDWVFVDPDGALLGKLDQKQTPAQWLAQLESSPSVFAQMEAVSELSDLDPTPASVEAIAGLVNGDRHPEFRADLALMLGDLGSYGQAAVTLVQASRDAHPKVRERAIDAMTDTASSAIFTSILEKRARNDDDARNRGSAILSLAEHDEAAALRLARRALLRPDKDLNGLEHELALRVIGAHGSLADGAAVLRFLGPSNPRAPRYGAAAAIANRLVDAEDGKRKDALQIPFTAAMVRWFDDPDYRIRSAAVRYLGIAGGPDAIDALEAFAARNPVPSLDERIEAAVRDVRQPPAGDEAERLDALEKKLDALQKDLEGNRGRLERLESWR